MPTIGLILSHSLLPRHRQPNSQTQQHKRHNLSSNTLIITIIAQTPLKSSFSSRIEAGTRDPYRRRVCLIATICRRRHLLLPVTCYPVTTIPPAFIVSRLTVCSIFNVVTFHLYLSVKEWRTIHQVLLLAKMQ